MVKENQGLETLQVWQRAVDFAVEICLDLVPCLPSDEKWALASQMRRAAQSIPANIAEGYGRYTYQETIRFCYIARGSIAETKTHLIMAYRLGYIDETSYHKYLNQLNELVKMLHGYIGHLRKQKSHIKEHPDLGEEYRV
jgi:four helix bundle protein